MGRGRSASSLPRAGRILQVESPSRPPLCGGRGSGVLLSPWIPVDEEATFLKSSASSGSRSFTRRANAKSACCHGCNTIHSLCLNAAARSCASNCRLEAANCWLRSSSSCFRCRLGQLCQPISPALELDLRAVFRLQKCNCGGNGHRDRNASAAPGVNPSRP